MKNKEITVLEQEIHTNKDDYFPLTDIAWYKNTKAPANAVKKRLRREGYIEFIGLREQLDNSNFNMVEFDQFKSEAEHNYFTLSPKMDRLSKCNRDYIKVTQIQWRSLRS